MFTDATHASKIASLSLPVSGWGNGLFDFNNDGWKDLFTANSHVNDRVEAFEAAVYKQPNSIFTNLGKGVFAASQIGEAKAHRGAAFADFNGDGRIDVAVSVLGEAAELWVNRTPDAGNWIIVRLIGSRSNRDGIGARVRAGSQYNQMTTAVGYASSSYTGVHFGLGKDTATDLEIRWPSGIVQHVPGVKANQVVTVREEAR
jgi:enediyne biosynthesis protein E4